MKEARETPPQPVESPPPEESPFPTPRLDTEERHATEAEGAIVDGVDPNESPFATPPVEGLPFDRDSDEARAIRQILEDAKEEPVTFD